LFIIADDLRAETGADGGARIEPLFSKPKMAKAMATI
jgi:hypothetical protein